MSLGHILILGFVLLLFGSKRLPDLGRAVGKSMRAFREGLTGIAHQESQKEEQDHSSSSRRDTHSPRS